MHLFFDLDNTLLDDSKAKDYYLPKLYEEFQPFIHRDFEWFRSTWVSAIEKFHKRYLAGQLTFAEQRTERIREALNNPKIPEHILGEVDTAFLRLFQESWTLFDGWRDYLSKSKIGKSIVTNGNGAQQRLKLKQLDIDQFFQFVHVSEEVGVTKPNRRIFEVALDAANEQAERCIMIGDSWEFDIAGACNAGLRPFWINHLQEKIPARLPNLEVFASVESLITRLWEIENVERR